MAGSPWARMCRPRRSAASCWSIRRSRKAASSTRLVEGLVKSHRRWPGGIYALWYPIKDRAAVNRFRRSLAELGVPAILDVAFSVRAPSHEPRLDGCGLVVVNPPYTFEQEMRLVLPMLKSVLADDFGAGWTLDWLAPEAATA